MKYKIIFFGVVLIILIVVTTVVSRETKPTLKNFSECIKAGYPVLESYPRRCTTNGEVFIEDIGNALEKQNLIVLFTPQPGTTIRSPLVIAGEARGNWFFEASFPLILVDGEGREIASSFATAQGEWMTTNFVPFTTTLIFSSPATSEGELVLKKDNPSGLPEHDDELRIPVFFSTENP